MYAIVIHERSKTMPASPSVLSVRVSKKERALLTSAAEQARTSLSDYVRRHAIEAAELALMEQSRITIPAKDWERFEQWVTAPAKPVEALRQLSQYQAPWER